MTFAPEDPVELVIKSFPHCQDLPDYPNDPIESARWWLDQNEVRRKGWDKQSLGQAFLRKPDQIQKWLDYEETRYVKKARIVSLWNVRVNREDLCALYGMSSCYVSAGRSEGFDLPAYDAKLCGLRMIYPDAAGGTADFATSQDVAICAERKPFHPMYKQDEKATWAGHEAEDIARALRYVADNPNWSKESLDWRDWSYVAVGQKMKASVLKVAESVGEAIGLPAARPT
jgi:hypothetical protein